MHPFPKTPETNLSRSVPEDQQDIIHSKNTRAAKNNNIIIIIIFVIVAMLIVKTFKTYELYHEILIITDAKYENDNTDGEKQDYFKIKIIDEAISVRQKSSSSIEIQDSINERPK